MKEQYFLSFSFLVLRLLSFCCSFLSNYTRSFVFLTRLLVWSYVLVLLRLVVCVKLIISEHDFGCV